MKDAQTYAKIATVFPENPDEASVDVMPFGYYLAFVNKRWTPVLICYGSGRGKLMVSLEDPQQTWMKYAKFSFRSLNGETITLKITTEDPT